MGSMKDFMETYCLCDTLLLSEVFERFKDESMENFEIEPGHFISLPGFAYQAFLKQTGVQMDYVTNADIFDMLSSNLRGGHSFASQRYEESSLFKKTSHKIDPGPQNVWKTGTEYDLQIILDINMNNLY